MDRLSATDVMQLITDVGPVPMQIGACLLLDAGPGFDAAAVRRCLAARIQAVPRLRQRLVRTPPGCGRPVWLDDPAFDVRHHVREQRCPAPGDDDALLGLVADVVATPLPLSRPPWGAVLVTGLTGHSAALILVLHHVLADGLGGLAVLASLADGDPAGPGGPGDRGPPEVPAAAPDGFPAPAPSRRSLAADAWAGRLRALRGLPGAVSRVRRSAAELGVRSPARAARCSLNQPTGPRRRIAVVTAGLAEVRALAHAHGGTVNDVILAAVAGAVRRLLAGRGETLPALVVSVPVSARA
ncbi:MAG TPA: wax ester/triacylglycerol synthase domain-containing protein, partial [Streptosporangiaceae bacterium]